MAHPILLGVLGGALAARFLFRRRWRRHEQGGGCGARRFGRWGGPRHWRGATEAPVVTLKLSALAESLELNQRQREDVDDLFARLKDTFSDRVAAGSPLVEILRAIAEEPYDAAAVEAAFLGAPQAKGLIDEIEHVHNILTSEQRQKLAAALGGGAANV